MCSESSDQSLSEVGGGGGGGGTIFVPIFTEGSGTPTMRPKTGFPVEGLGAGGERR